MVIKIISATVFMGAILYLALSQNDPPTKTEASKQPGTAHAPLSAMRAGAGNPEPRSAAIPWLSSPFGSRPEAAANDAPPGPEETATFLDPDYLDAALKVLCYYETSDVSEQKIGPPDPTGEMDCSDFNQTQLQQGIATIQNYANSGDVEATLFLSYHWLMEQKKHAAKNSSSDLIAGIEENNRLQPSGKLENDSSADQRSENQTRKDSRIEQGLAKVEDQLLKLSASGRPDVFRELAMIYASKEPNAENMEWMFAHQLASDMRHPDIMLNKPTEDSLKELPFERRAGVQQKTEALMAKCCSN